MVLYWHLALFAAMKAVAKTVAGLKGTGTTHQMKDDLFTYADYEEVTELSKWMDVNEKYR